MTEQITEVMARAILDAMAANQTASTNNYMRDEDTAQVTIDMTVNMLKALHAFTSAGYVIMTTAERDGIRAVAMAEAADVAESMAFATAEDGKLREAILALAQAPTGMVCVPVDKVVTETDLHNRDMIKRATDVLRPYQNMTSIVERKP